MLDDSNDMNLETPDEQPPEESGNKTFLIVGGIMAGLVFLTLVCMAVYFLVIGPKLTAQRSAAQATTEAENAQVMQAATATAEAALWTPTALPSPLPTQTNPPVLQTATTSPTPVLALNIPTETQISDPATLAAMQTQLAQEMTTTALAVATRAIGGEGMPTTGFFDDVGLPSLIILTLALVTVIFFARRLRKAPSK